MHIYVAPLPWRQIKQSVNGFWKLRTSYTAESCTQSRSIRRVEFVYFTASQCSKCALRPVVPLYFSHKRMATRGRRAGRVLRLRNILRLHKIKLFNFIIQARARTRIHCQMRGANKDIRQNALLATRRVRKNSCAAHSSTAAHSVDGAHVCHSSQSMGQQLSSSGITTPSSDPFFFFFIIHSFIQPA